MISYSNKTNTSTFLVIIKNLIKKIIEFEAKNYEKLYFSDFRPQSAVRTRDRKCVKQFICFHFTFAEISIFYFTYVSLSVKMNFFHLQLVFIENYK